MSDLLALSPNDPEFKAISTFNIIQEAGVDSESRPILVLSACNLPDPNIINYDLILRFLLARLDEFVESDYVLVFLAAPAAYRPPWMWLLKAYRALDRSYLSELNSVIPVSQLNLPLAVRPYDEKLPRLNTTNSTTSHRETKALPGLAFCVSLERLAEFDNANEADERYVPAVVKQIIEHLRENGLLQKGIFRKSPSSEELKFVKDELNRGVKVDLGRYDIHVTASLLKVFFRELPQAPLSLEFLESVGPISDGPEQSIDELRSQFEKFYGDQTKHKALLKYLFTFLHEVSQHSDQNLMTVHNIAVIFAPNLLRADSESSMPDPALYLQQMNKGMGLVRLLVQESEQIINNQ
ncbi:hypothetical protein Unana1_00615 [Umbelopsis nana]